MASSVLTALHGDDWSSPWFGIALGTPKAPGETLEEYVARLEAVDLSAWRIRAQARQQPQPSDETPLFDWTVAGGGIVFERLQLVLSDGTECRLPCLQLRLVPDDWVDRPSSWAGFVEVQLERGPDGAPTARHTVVRKRKFKIVSDYVP